MSSREATEILRYDPLAIETELPLFGIFNPVGFQVQIATNSRDVLKAAAECWDRYRPEFECEPIRFRVVVRPEGERCQPPMHRAQGNLYAVVADPHNFASIDLKSLTGMMFVSQKTASDYVWMRWFFIESLAYLLLAQRYVAPIHAACVERNGTGVLLSGKAGAGKSTLTFACARAGWTYVTDDCSWLLIDSEDRIAIGRPWQVRFRADAPSLFPELEGQILRARPTGKVSIEVPLSAFPEIRTADRAAIGRIVFLERGPGCRPRLIPISGEETMDRILRDMPSYGPEVNAMHERTVRRLSEVAGYRMQFESLDDGIALLDTLGQAESRPEPR